MSTTRSETESVRERYPVGTQIELIDMRDDYAVPPGTKGAVAYVDDMATIHVLWENGSTLGLIADVDRFSVLENNIKQTKNKP